MAARLPPGARVATIIPDAAERYISKGVYDCMKISDKARFSTVCIHAGQEPDPSTGAIITPIFQTSTYVQEALGQHKGYEYARTQNPTRAALEANLAAIEGGKGGVCVRLGHGGDRRRRRAAQVRRSRRRHRQHVRRDVSGCSSSVLTRYG